MEVRRVLLVAFFALYLAACSNNGSSAVFPESQRVASVCESQLKKNEFIVHWQDGRITLEHDRNAEAFKENFIEPQLDKISHVEFNKRIQVSIPSRISSRSSGVSTSASNLVNWGQTAIEASAAWSRNIKGQGVKVAVVDTAIDLDHPQLAGQIAINQAEANGFAGVDDDGNGLVDDIKGWDFLYNRKHGLGNSSDEHGTHVAGIIAADPAFGPIQGLAPQAQIIAASFLSESGDGDLFGAIRSLEYAAAQGAKVINASWGGPNCSESLRMAMKSLSEKDVVVVVAAGNDGVDIEQSPDYPAAYEFPTQITVAAIRPTGYMAGFSNTSFRYVHVAAPGETIYSTIPHNEFAAMDGTSMAAPFVTGAAALLRSLRPSATAKQVRDALLSSVDLGNYRVSTKGRLNIRKAMAALEAAVPETVSAPTP